jgi:hypothetical protein
MIAKLADTAAGRAGQLANAPAWRWATASGSPTRPTTGR